ncbi:hypothetical protein [Ekhidna sp.]
MTEQLKKIAKLISMLCLVAFVFSACEDASVDIYDNVELKDEETTDEGKDVKASPKTKVLDQS